MSDPREILAKTTPGSSWSIEFLDRGPVGLTRPEIMGLLVGLDRRPYLLAIAKWCDDWTVLAELERHAWDIAITCAVDGKWKIPAGEMLLRKMAGLALDEVINDYDKKCKKCNGTDHECPLCLGTGLTPRSNRQRAKWIGRDEAAWRYTWRCRYAPILKTVMSWDIKAREHIIKRNSSKY